MRVTRHSSRGDTLVEVLFATAVFSLVAVGSLSIMNSGTGASQRALEVTLVRQEIDAQAETLRFMNASYVANYPIIQTTGPDHEWLNIMSKAVASTVGVTAYSGGATCVRPPAGHPYFILNTHKATLDSFTPVLANTYSQVVYASDVVTSAEGIWIEAVKSPAGGSYESSIGYIDFHIRACWSSAGQSAPVTLGTIVRLYEPLP